VLEASPSRWTLRTRHAAAAEERGRSGVRWGRVLLTAVGFVLAFHAIEHDPEAFAGKQVQDTTEDRIRDAYIDGAEDGDAGRKLAITSFGLAGLIALAACRERNWNVRPAAAAVVGALVLWAAASVMWSDEPGLTMRRLAASGLIFAGALGYARLLRPDELAAVALVSFTAFVTYSLALELGNGGQPWAEDYRFGGSLHPNIQAAYCGVLCLAAFTFPAPLDRRWLVRGLVVYGFVLLLQTQSRTSALATLGGLAMVFLIRLRPSVRYAAALALVCFASLSTVVLASQSDGARNQMTDAALLGRTEGAGSLSGRVPLWNELADYAARRWVQGYGYDSFWTADRIAEVMKSQKWALQSAHNAYIEVVLQLGWVGLLLGVAMLVGGFNLLQTAYARTGAAGYAFGYGVLAFAIANGLLESHFAKLKYPTVIALIALLSVVAFYPEEVERTTDADADGDRGHAAPTHGQRRRALRPAAREGRRSA